MIVYIYIFEDGTIRQSLNVPTELDIECSNQGTLTILKVVNSCVFEFHEYNWIEVRQSELVADSGGKQFHSYI